MTRLRTIKIKRIYDPPAEDDGFRVLVDRLWPRGVTKENANIDLWAKQITPSTELRKWFNHEPAKFVEFRERYTRELEANAEAVMQVLEAAGDQTVTLLYAARDPACNHALVLLDFVRKFR